MGRKANAREAELLRDYRRMPMEQRYAVAQAASPQLRARLAVEERRMAMDRSPGGMAAAITGGTEKQAPHLDLIDQVFQRIAAGERLHVMITMPPRHGKSQRASRWGPLWYLRKHPTHRVILASYGSDLADDHGRWVRDQLGEHHRELGIQLHPASRAAMRFDLLAPKGSSVRGGMVTAGVGGGITGKGFNLGIIDDPFKGIDDSSSPAARERVWQWYQAVFFTRRASGASIILINTRWHEDDLSGRLLESQSDQWIKIDLPAIADSADDALGRTLGQPLWPSQYDVDELDLTRTSVGERVWAALYQQKPRPLEGGVWKWAWIDDNRLDLQAMPGIDLTRVVVAVDPAGGDSVRNDEVGLIGAGRDRNGELYLLADRSASMGSETWGLAACRLAVELRADALIVEGNFGGDMAAQILRQAWAQLEREGATGGMLMPLIKDVRAKQGKRLRAEPIAQLYAQGRVHHVSNTELGILYDSLEGQMVTWMAGMDSPDRMDAAVHALTELADPNSSSVGQTNRTHTPLPGRR